MVRGGGGEMGGEEALSPSPVPLNTAQPPGLLLSLYPSFNPLLCSALQRPAQGRTWPTSGIDSVTGSSSFVRTPSRTAQPTVQPAPQVAWGTNVLSGVGWDQGDRKGPCRWM